MFGILLRPLPIFENIKIIDKAFWQIMYVLLPEITYYLLVVYSVKKVFELKNKLLYKTIAYVLITPITLFALKLMPLTINNLGIFLKYCFNLKLIKFKIRGNKITKYLNHKNYLSAIAKANCISFTRSCGDNFLNALIKKLRFFF